jgi:hypothetical protein
MVLPQCALVRAAIGLVKKQYQGASLLQIRKHLEATYREKFDTKKKKLIHNTFKTLIQEGKLLQRGTIYKSTKKCAIVRANIPQRHNKKRHCCKQHLSQRRHRRRRHRRKYHHRRRHHRRRHLRRRYHGSRRHHRRKHHRRHHGRHHGRRHHRIRVYRSNKRTFPHIHHGQGISGNPSIEIPVDKLTLSPNVTGNVPKLSEQKN